MPKNDKDQKEKGIKVTEEDLKQLLNLKDDYQKLIINYTSVLNDMINTYKNL